MLSVVYDPVLVLASVLVAVMAAFTGLRLTNGLRLLQPNERKRAIAQAAIALGGGIWSMHFVGMLAVNLPITIAYDALPTLGSVLIAILVTGIGLIILHFGVRTQTRIVLAGTLTGLGIISMHYLGMSAISGNCIVTYTPAGVVLATAIGIASSILALELAYRRRTLLATAGGAVVLGLAISAMHYTAMLFTGFQRASDVSFIAAPVLSSGVLAMVVALSAFVICGLFLLMAIPAGLVEVAEAGAMRTKAAPAGTAWDGPGHGEPAISLLAAAHGRQAVFSQASAQPALDMRAGKGLLPPRIPYERENAIRFLALEQVAAVRADGHYTRVINDGGEYFCPWSISRVEQEIQSPPFMRTHRSYLVNLKHVTGFKREGDKAFCLVCEDEKKRIPVSRSRIAKVQRALGLA